MTRSQLLAAAIAIATSTTALADTTVAVTGCVTATVDDLTAQDLYDPRVETAKQTTLRLRSLFP
jgi:hypothetical protein